MRPKRRRSRYAQHGPPRVTLAAGFSFLPIPFNLLQFWSGLHPRRRPCEAGTIADWLRFRLHTVTVTVTVLSL